jgi:hypothetical protein
VAVETQATKRVLLLSTDSAAGEELIDELRRRQGEGEVKVIVVAPAVEDTPFHHALGDVDAASREAGKRLERLLGELRRNGVHAIGEVGDSDPVVAAEDALRSYPVDEVLIVSHADDQARWFEHDLFERAQESLYPATHLLTVREGPTEGELHVVGDAEAGPGRAPAHDGSRAPVRISANLPSVARSDLAGIVIAIVGTIAAIVLAAAGPGPQHTAGAVQILIAMAVALINMAHVVGLVLLDSVGYHGGWQRFFRRLSLIATPAAVIANLVLTLVG